VASWVGVVYVAFVIDAYAKAHPRLARRDEHAHPMVLDALDQAVLGQTPRRRQPRRADPSHRRGQPGQYTSITFTERLAAIGASPSIGTVGDAYDALAEPVVGLYKAERIYPQRPWKTLEEVEITTVRYIDWFNNTRLYEENGDIPLSNWSRGRTA
jgi:putative transposase